LRAEGFMHPGMGKMHWAETVALGLKFIAEGFMHPGMRWRQKPGMVALGL